jgi:hypothetical protein
MSSSKRHFTAVIDSKEYGIYVSSTPSSAAKKVVSKLCANNKNKKVKFSIRETTRVSNKKIYGPYIGYMQKLDKPVELEGRVIRYKPVAKLDKKSNEDFILHSKIKQKGGMNCVNERVFKNILGTCWMISIQMMMCFGDATKEQFERELAQPNTTTESIINLDKILKKFFPSKYSCLETTERIRHLSILLNAFILRYIAKIERHSPFSVNLEENPKRCELVIRQAFILLFQKLLNIEDIGGDILDFYFFANLLSAFFLKQEIYFSMHTRKMFNQIHFDEQNIGIIIHIEKHACCFFVCGGVPKFYNDNDKKIHDFNFMDLLSNLQDDEDLFVIPNQVVALNRTDYFENIENYTEYKRIQLLTVISKKDFGNNFNQEIKLFFDEEYDEINNFCLLPDIAIKFLREGDEDKTLYFLIKGLKDEYFKTMYILGDYFENLHKREPPAHPDDESYLDKSIEYYQKALDNGYNKAAKKLCDIYYKKEDYSKSDKYHIFEFWTRKPQKTNSE